MRPGAWSSTGFLGQDESLSDRLTEDAALCRMLGIEPRDLGRRLGELVAAEGSDWFSPVRVGEHEVEIRKNRGFVTCPWAPEELEPCLVGEGSPATANQFAITYLPTGRRLEGLVISAHMIRDHGFFGGPGTRFRIEPAEAAAALGGSASA